MMELVLIETLWNVKRDAVSRHCKGVVSINRNIVECKEVWGNAEVCGDAVLIETLWNVKEVLNLNQSGQHAAY